MNKFTDDKESEYVIAIESTSTEPVEIIKDSKNKDGVNFLRFKACLQTFGKLNRNRRMWYSKFARPMFESPEIKELLREGGVPGENGHPVPPTGNVTIERILTIDPNNVSHVVKEYMWPNKDRVEGIIETVDDINGPGAKFRKNILQGLPTTFSTRSVIPQKKQLDGTIIQTGIGRYVCSDRVYLPSHEDAKLDLTFAIKDICTMSKFEQVMESYSTFVADTSDKVKRIVDNMSPAIEQASMNKNGMISIPVESESSEERLTVGIYPEMKYRREFYDLMNNL